MELAIAVAMLGENERKRVKIAVEAPEDYGLGFACGAVAANSEAEGGDVPDDAAAAVTTALFNMRTHNKPAVIAATQAAFLQAFKLLE